MSELQCPSFFSPAARNPNLNSISRRAQANCYKKVESFCFSAETLMNKSIRDIKLFVNSQVAGINGPAKEYSGQ